MKKISLIDDSHTDILLLTAWFELSNQYKVINCFYSGIDAVRQSEILQSDICIIDTRMPSLNGIETTFLLLQKGYTGKIIGVSHAYYHEDMLKSKAAGAHGYCSKEKKPIFNTISKLVNDANGYDDEHYKDWQNNTGYKTLKTKDADYRKHLLNPHFKKILLYSCKGLATAEIAELMGLKKHTIEQYRAAMLQKLEFNSIAQATAWAIASQTVSSSEAFTPPQKNNLLNDFVLF